MHKEATTQEIKHAYLSKAREYHPDKRPQCLEYFTHVTKAYDTLSDQQRRAIYDDESIPDEEYFTIEVGDRKVNLFTIVSVSAFLGLGAFGYMFYFN